MSQFAWQPSLCPFSFQRTVTKIRIDTWYKCTLNVQLLCSGHFCMFRHVQNDTFSSDSKSLTLLKSSLSLAFLTGKLIPLSRFSGVYTFCTQEVSILINVNECYKTYPCCSNGTLGSILSPIAFHARGPRSKLSLYCFLEGDDEPWWWGLWETGDCPDFGLLSDEDAEIVNSGVWNISHFYILLELMSVFVFDYCDS